MKEYPSITNVINMNYPIVAFDKLDGSNIRAEWNKKKGFWKFGSRHRLIGPDDPIYSDETVPLKNAIPLIKMKYERDLHDILVKTRTEKAILFFEFYGPTSAFGRHNPNEEQTVTLIDVNLFKKGIMPPREFIKMFGHLDIPAVLHDGKANQPFVISVENSELKGMTLEGVVCKGPFEQKSGGPVMFKIKSKKWLDKLRNYCAGNETLFDKLK